MGSPRRSSPVHVAFRRRIPCPVRSLCCEFVGLHNSSSGILATRATFAGQTCSVTASIDPSGVVVKNIVLCFDRARHHPGPREASNAEALLRLLDESEEQVTWYHPGTRVPTSGRSRLARLRWHEAAADDARATIAEAYEFLVDWWDPGDRIFIFWVGRGASCAHALTRLLGTVAVLPDLMDYVLATYALPRTRRSPQDWQRVTLMAARLAGLREIGVPVQFLGLWDMAKVPGRQETRMTNVVAGRHAV